MQPSPFASPLIHTTRNRRRKAPRKVNPSTDNSNQSPLMKTAAPTLAKPSTAALARQALDGLNACRGRGSILAVRLCLDGKGEADRRGQYFTDKIRFRVETTKRGKLRVFALGSSRIANPAFA